MGLRSESSTLPQGGDPQIVPGYKWIRGVHRGKTIVDSRSFLFVWEVPYWPWWYFPRGDIKGRLEVCTSLAEDPKLPPGCVRYNVVSDGMTLEGAARGYPDHPRLGDMATFEFRALDHWFEEDVEVFVHPRSPFTRVDALASSRHIVVSLDGVKLADSHRPTVLFETGAPARYYVPLTDVHLDVVRPNDRRQSCPYKGDASFFSAEVNGGLVEDVAWTYVLPRPESAPIAGLIGFFNERLDIDIDGQRQERPRTHFS